MAGSVVVTHHPPATTVGRIVLAITADAADGSVPDTVLPPFEGYLMALITNPGATAPTDDYDLTVIDGEGADRLQSVGLNRDTANTEQVGIVYSSTSLHPPVGFDETLTFKVAANAVHSALISATLFYATRP